MKMNKYWYESGPVKMSQVHRLTAPAKDGQEIGYNAAGGIDRCLRLHHESRASATMDSHVERRARVLYMAGYGAAIGSPNFMKFLFGGEEGFFPEQGLPGDPALLAAAGRADVLLVDRRANMLALCAALGIQWYQRDQEQIARIPIAKPRWVSFRLESDGMSKITVREAMRRCAGQIGGQVGMTLYDGLAAYAHGVQWGFQLFLTGSMVEDRVPILTCSSQGVVSLRFGSMQEKIAEHCDKIGVINELE